jgi:hypothetical protein
MGCHLFTFSLLCRRRGIPKGDHALSCRLYLNNPPTSVGGYSVCNGTLFIEDEAFRHRHCPAYRRSFLSAR